MSGSARQRSMKESGGAAERVRHHRIEGGTLALPKKTPSHKAPDERALQGQRKGSAVGAECLFERWTRE